MIDDILTVMRKEFKEIANMRESRRGLFLALMVPAIIIGIVMPLQLGRKWVETPGSLVTWVMIPFILIATVIADSFAGERERHTLETLLSTRLPDSAILFGKITAALCYALGVTAIISLMGLVSVNIVYVRDGFLMFPPYIIFASIALGLFTGSLAVLVGTLVSLRSATVRQAQQTLGLLMMALYFVPMIIIQFIPGTVLNRLEVFLDSFDSRLIIVVVIIFFLIFQTTLLCWVMARFKRNRMMLD